MTDYSTLDALKDVAAQSRFAVEKVAELSGNQTPELEAAVHLLAKLNSLLHTHLFAFSSPDDPRTQCYSDGRDTVSEVEIEPGGLVWRHIWHPDPHDEHNHPGTVIAEIPWKSGATKRFVVAAPGFIDVVTIPDGEREC